MRSVRGANITSLFCVIHGNSCQKKLQRIGSMIDDKSALGKCFKFKLKTDSIKLF